MSYRPKKSLRVIAEAEANGRPIIAQNPANYSPPVFKADGLTDYVCGKCSYILLEGYGGIGFHISGTVFRCRCGALNLTPETGGGPGGGGGGNLGGAGRK